MNDITSYFSFVKSDKYESEDTKKHLERDCGQKCRFGFCWWFWLPRIRFNLRLRFGNIDFIWFCYLFSISWPGFKK